MFKKKLGLKDKKTDVILLRIWRITLPLFLNHRLVKKNPARLSDYEIYKKFSIFLGAKRLCRNARIIFQTQFHNLTHCQIWYDV